MTQSILLIDDNEINLELMSYLLGAFGYDVRTASDGPSGLMAAERDLPDLILCDVVMPEMDGYMVARALAANPRLAEVSSGLQFSLEVGVENSLIGVPFGSFRRG